MPAAASNIATIRAGARSATKANTERCFCSARRCRGSGRRCRQDLARRHAAREGAGGDRTPARDDADARRQRGVWQTNKSYGLTTLRNRHVKVEGSSRIHFDFRGKHGTEHHIDLRDKRLASIVRRCQELPGQELFQYLDDSGTPHVSVPKTSTSICVLSPVPKSPPRIFAPGRQPIWQRWRCGNLRVSIARRRPRATWCRQSKRSPRCLATRRRFAGNATSIRRCSTAISRARCCRR